ncbi:MAG: hypothetical protein A2Y33_03195 [Spirochaetes bacterium GWF1_51_8]|nr:MAG: hypothetical protein A2Y33_03195 [Spirochaetes bacterium GWF1_51_8]
MINERILQAALRIDLPETFSIKELKAQYKKLLREVHPDRCSDNMAECNEKTALLNESYKLLLEYCENYPISVKGRIGETAQDFWDRRFGNDPMWK